MTPKAAALAGTLVLFAGCDACGNRPGPDDRDAPTVTAEAPRQRVTTTFGRRAPAVGDRWEERVDMHLRIDLAVDPGTGKVTSSALETSGVERRLEQVLAVEGEAVTMLRASFLEKSETLTEAGKEKPRRSAVSGKSYVVAAAGGHVLVTDDKGKPVSAVEAREVEQHYPTLGKPDPILAAMPTTPVDSTQPLSAVAKALEQEVAVIADGAVLSDARVVLADVTPDVGTFDVSFKLTRDDGPLRLVMLLKGQLKVARATSWPIGLDVKGPVTASAITDDGDGGRQRLEGRGELGLAIATKAQ